MDWYILFKNHTDGLKVDKALKDAGIKHTISPTPRELSLSCGISIKIENEDLKQINNILDIQKLNYLDIKQVERKKSNKFYV